MDGGKMARSSVNAGPKADVTPAYWPPMAGSGGPRMCR